MALRLTFQLKGMKAVQERFGAMGKGDEMKRRLAQRMYAEGTKIMSASQALAPVDRGQLRQSGHVQLPVIEGDRITVGLGYSAIYAYSVHENPRAGNTGGRSPSGKKYSHWAKVGTWHFLSTPFIQWRQGSLDIFAEELRAVLSVATAIRRAA